VRNDLFESILKESFQLTYNAIIGFQLLKEYVVSINFDRGNFNYVQGAELREHLFVTKVGLKKVISDNRRVTGNPFRLNNPSRGQRPQPLSADCESNFPTRSVHSCSDPTPHQTVEAGTYRNRGVGNGITVICETQCRSEELKGSGSLINGTEGDQFINDVKRINNDMLDVLISQIVGYISRDATHKRDLDVEYMRKDLPVCDPIPNPESDSSDSRSLRKTDLSALVEQVVSLSEAQRRRLYEVLVKYLSHMKTKPGRCNLFSYKFQVNTHKPILGYSRRILFASRPAVREQINQILRDGILETSTSLILNPLKIINREGKKIRIFLDARKVN
jgi:hypothetical protein